MCAREKLQNLLFSTVNVYRNDFLIYTQIQFRGLETL